MFKIVAFAGLLFLCTFSLSAQNSIVINKIFIEGNKITQPYIIHKELTFHEGDTLSLPDFIEKTVQSRKNLLNTSLFNFVDILYNNDSLDFNVTIAVKERWYTWPQPIAIVEDRNFFDWWQYKTLDRLSYGLYLYQYNLWGRRESIETKLKLGYSQEIGVAYKIPYLVKHKNHGLNFSFLSVKRHEIYYKSFNDKITYMKDHNNIMRTEFNANVEYVYRNKIYQQHSLKFDYDEVEVRDTIVNPIENPNYLIDGKNHASYFSFRYLYKKDKRDSKNYPLEGYDYDVEIKKIGFNFGAGNINTASLTCTAEKFWKLKEKIYFAAGLRARAFATPTAPFYIARGLGFSPDYVRGYEPYLISGTNFVVVKSNLKYQLLKPRIFKIPYLKIEKFNTFHYAFYINALFDVGYIQDKTYTTNNSLANTLLIGYGVGLDFVTYYDKVLRVEYSLNKKGLSGIYLSFIAPI
ncbi:MAG: BamA/TamA family outer membrane protein [Bacteroidetes bacterium]|nr:BamA/TamA family outer membrane protein [Bacteroidota bacterium]